MGDNRGISRTFFTAGKRVAVPVTFAQAHRTSSKCHLFARILLFGRGHHASLQVLLLRRRSEVPREARRDGGSLPALLPDGRSASPAEARYGGTSTILFRSDKDEQIIYSYTYYAYGTREALTVAVKTPTQTFRLPFQRVPE
jgi:hypothetical protein